ncbi:hypothetical protein SSX86_015771 [Deinandra increscens subsp. villosa]|uniref:Uncharacterized protein n=1 Tax=Deinandra increscens subsp. villosa TaxID=3103831 RepID=A0AAP0D400_9ASTR
MWANTTLSYRLWPPATATVSAANNHRAPFTVSAKHTRPRKNIQYDYDDEETENDRELETLKQQREIGDPDVYSSNSEKISGSAVLLALQKASAQKTSKKIKEKKSKNVKEDEGNRRKQGDLVDDFVDVKPLCIKSDWKDRLDELETQLHQLIHHS